MTSHVLDPEICWRIDFEKWRIWQLMAFDAVRRGQMNVSEARSLCSRTRVNEFPSGGRGGGHPPGLSTKSLNIVLLLHFILMPRLLQHMCCVSVSYVFAVCCFVVKCFRGCWLYCDAVWCEALSSRGHNLRIRRSSSSNGGEPFLRIFLLSKCIQMKHSRFLPPWFST